MAHEFAELRAIFEAALERPPAERRVPPEQLRCPMAMRVHAHLHERLRD